MRKAEARELYKQKRKDLSDAERTKADDLMLIQFQTMELPYIHHCFPIGRLKKITNPILICLMIILNSKILQ